MAACYAYLLCFFVRLRSPSRFTRFPYTTLFRSGRTGRGTPLGTAPTGPPPGRGAPPGRTAGPRGARAGRPTVPQAGTPGAPGRSEEHTSELQSRFDLVCRLLLEKKKITCHVNSW